MLGTLIKLVVRHVIADEVAELIGELLD